MKMKSKLDREREDYRALMNPDNWAIRELSQSKFPTPASVWRSPTTALVPTDSSGQYLAALILCQSVGPNPKRHEALIVYASRLYRPIGAFCIARLFRNYQRSIPTLASYRAWFIRNQDLFNPTHL